MSEYAMEDVKEALGKLASSLSDLANEVMGMQNVEKKIKGREDGLMLILKVLDSYVNATRSTIELVSKGNIKLVNMILNKFF